MVMACSEGQNVPNNVLSPDKMRSVLYDVFRADELMGIYLPKDSTYKTPVKRAGMYQSVFNAHKISRDDFKRSMNYYESHPDLLKKILDSLQKQVNNPVIRKDSLSKKMHAV
jgi:hypothetical protein